MELCILALNGLCLLEPKFDLELKNQKKKLVPILFENLVSSGL